jgi:hypothetical protein
MPQLPEPARRRTNEQLSEDGMSEAVAARGSRGTFAEFAGLARALSTLRAPFAMAGLTILALWLPQQVREVYRVLAQPASAQPVTLQWQWVLAAVSLGLLALVLWQASRELAHLASEDQSLDRQPVAKAVLDWAPRLLATAPFIGVALGTWYSFLPNKRTLGDAGNIPPVLQAIIEDARALQAALSSQAVWACAAALAVFALITLFERFILRIGPARQLTETRARRLSLINNWFLFPLVGVASMVAFALYPDVLPQYFGIIPIFALWVTITTVLACAGTRFHDVSGIPIITIAVLAVFLFQFAGWSDNHKFRHSETATVKRPALEEAFADWIASRKDAAAYAGRTYPVYIVAAQGGGIYAAYRTAKVLTRLQDLCPSFAQHLFAVSSVSGGSLGAGIFSALVQRKPGNIEPQACKQAYEGTPGPLESAAQALLSDDFLSPLVWSGLFPDFVQRFLPVPIYAWDRAVTLERSFETAWKTHIGGDNPFAQSFFALCGPGSTRCAKEDVAAPALFLNTTNIETGAQMVLSPTWLGQAYIYGIGTLEDFHRKSAVIKDIPLSTAIGLSARFPWILPVGWYEVTIPPPLGTDEKPQTRRLTFVDGGYSEGSGVSTAENLAQYLVKFAETNPQAMRGLRIAPKIIMIGGSYEPVDQFYTTEPHKRSYDEVTAPLEALLRAWGVRSTTVAVEAGLDRPRGPYSARLVQFDNEYIPLPLGWQIGALSRRYLDLFTGRPQNCVRRLASEVGDDDTRGALAIINRNDCMVREVIEDLQPALTTSGSR